MMVTSLPGLIPTSCESLQVASGGSVEAVPWLRRRESTRFTKSFRIQDSTQLLPPSRRQWPHSGNRSWPVRPASLHGHHVFHLWMPMQHCDRGNLRPCCSNLPTPRPHIWCSDSWCAASLSHEIGKPLRQWDHEGALCREDPPYQEQQ